MTDIEKKRLEAKIQVANKYLETVIAAYGEYSLYDAYKVVTREMRSLVKIVSQEQAEKDGKGYVRIREQGVA